MSTDDLPVEREEENLPAESEADDIGFPEGIDKRAYKQIVASYSRQGPLPSPRELEAYERACPGAAAKIIAHMEREQAHRHSGQNAEREIFKNAQEAESRFNSRGQHYALASVILIVSLCAYAFYLGNPDQAKTIAIVVIIGLAGVFLTNKIVDWSKNSEEKKDPTQDQGSQPGQ